MAERKKKSRMGDAIRNFFEEKTGAKAVSAGLDGRAPTDSMAPATAPAPSLSPKRDPQFQTAGIFDQTKYDAYMEKKRREGKK